MVVVATKFTWNQQPGNPNAGGNVQKNVRRALDGSLRRLRTGYSDIYWLHFWDMVTPLEEVLDTLVTRTDGADRHVILGRRGLEFPDRRSTAPVCLDNLCRRFRLRPHPGRPAF